MYILLGNKALVKLSTFDFQRKNIFVREQADTLGCEGRSFEVTAILDESAGWYSSY